MALPDPGGTQIVLIGAARYEHEENLPAVANNLGRLAELLGDTAVGGQDPSHIHVVLDPDSPIDVLRVVNRAAQSAEDMLLIYFSGHGLVSPDDARLYLALEQATSWALHEAVRYEDIRSAIMRSPARAKVAILDCCFSGQAMEGSMGAGDMASNVADQAGLIDEVGTYLLTATAETELALAPPGDDYTAFTGELIAALSSGVPSDSDLLNMDMLFYHMRNNLMAKGRPLPQNRERNGGRSIVLARNVHGEGKPDQGIGATASIAYMEIPAGYEHARRLRPQQLIEMIDELREDALPAVADQILAAIATRWPDQEIVSLMNILRDRSSGSDLHILMRHAASRTADDVVEVLSVMGELADRADVRAFTRFVGAGPAKDVAAVCYLLREQWLDPLAELVMDAARQSRSNTAEIIDLVGALWSVRLEADIDRLLDAAASTLSAKETIELADALVAAGREEAALRFYSTVLDTIGTMHVSRVVTILESFQRGQLTSETELLLALTARQRRSQDSLMEIAGALWAAGHADWAERVLQEGAEGLDAEEGVALVDSLWSADRRETALSLAEKVSIGPDARGCRLILDLLYSLGRPLDARRIVAKVASTDRFPAVLGALRQQGSPAEADRLLAAFADDEATRVTRLVRMIVDFYTRQDAGQFHVLIHIIVEDFPADFVRVLVRLASHDGEGRSVADAFVEGGLSGPAKTTSVLSLLEQSQMSDELGRMLLRASKDESYAARYDLARAINGMRESLTGILAFLRESLLDGMMSDRMHPPLPGSAYDVESQNRATALAQVLTLTMAAGVGPLPDGVFAMAGKLGVYETVALFKRLNMMSNLVASNHMISLIARNDAPEKVGRLATALHALPDELKAEQLLSEFKHARSNEVHALIKVLRASGEKVLLRKLW